MAGLLELDVRLFRAINSISNPVTDWVMYLVSLVGEMAIIIWIICLIAAIIDRNKGLHALIACIVGIFFSDHIVGHSLKWLCPRLRPHQYLDGVRVLGHKWTNGSFPSGHADSILAGAVILSYFYPRMALPLYLFSALTCFSRVYNGMHHPLDVCAGALTGIVSGYAIIALYRWKIEKPRSAGLRRDSFPEEGRSRDNSVNPAETREEAPQ